MGMTPRSAHCVTVPTDAVHVRKNGIEFRNHEAIPAWTEMTVSLQGPNPARKVNFTGVVVACASDNRGGLFDLDVVHPRLQAVPGPLARLFLTGFFPRPAGKVGDMETFRRILAAAVEGGASDVHLKMGAPIVFRINRKLVIVEGPLPTAEWMETVVDNIVPQALQGAT